MSAQNLNIDSPGPFFSTSAPETSQASGQSSSHGQSPNGVDTERTGMFSVFGYLIIPLMVPLLVLTSYYASRVFSPWLLLVTPVFVFGIVPILDFLVGTDTFNANDETLKRLADQKRYRYITYALVPGQILLLGWGAQIAGTVPLSAFEFVLLAINIGLISGGLGITFAHELCHKSNRLEQTLGKILLLMTSYMHFAIEHNLGHHVNVSTPKDPASSRLGESFYRFYPRTVIGSFRSAWNLETRRLERSNLAIWSHHNQMLWFVALPLLLAVALGAAFGWMATPFFFLQSIVGFSLLEVVNYLEHYGLERREIAPGRYERVNPLHSWNSNNKVTNGFLIMLQRHSDHHANPQRRYQTLRHFDESPQLPTGYAGMILLAVIPPLWFKVMDPRVAAYKAQIARDNPLQRGSSADVRPPAATSAQPAPLA